MLLDQFGNYVNASGTMLINPLLCNVKGALGWGAVPAARAGIASPQCAARGHQHLTLPPPPPPPPPHLPCMYGPPAADSSYSCQEQCLLTDNCVAWMFGVDGDLACQGLDADGNPPPYNATDGTGCPQQVHHAAWVAPGQELWGRGCKWAPASRAPCRQSC